MDVQTINNLPQMTDEKLIHMYEQMLLIRVFEEKVDEFFKRGLIYGTTHLCIGQEATAVGTCAVLQDGDKITSTHRGHGHSIAHGASIDRMMAELFGRTTGYCKGKGGSMHIADVDSGNLGANGIVGGSIPLAVGAALTAKMKGLSYVTVCFFGDGATNEGSFHESLNMASIWQLPVVFVCENNQYGMSSSVKEMTNIEQLSTRAKAYGFPGVTIDGNDLIQVIKAADEAVKRARSGKGPTLIEMETYRWMGHSKSDRGKYRTKAEVDKWKERDPIGRYEKLLCEAGLLTQEKISVIKENVEQQVQASIEYAEKSPKPSPADVLSDVYAP
ncbi:MAG TPA: thiamine pyrophosphate-dependent dehydrogenase E1 component subunit alpha [Bacillota bacterium]|nr:thiamine pyrophosphate-dependent dehydrogenase E1 component subunit alpha [Bacillota bacterium]